MITNRFDHLLAQAIHAFGPGDRLEKLQEECGEVVSAVSHYRADRQRSDIRLAEEIAHCYLALRGAELALGVEVEVRRELECKAAQIWQRIQEG